MRRIYLFSPIPYSFLHQRPQHLADQFVARGMAVTFVEPCGLTEYLQGRKKGLLSLLIASVWFQVLGFLALIVPRLGSAPPRRAEAQETSRGLTVVSMPMVYPANRVNSAFLEKFNASVFRQALKSRVLRSVGPKEESIAIVQNPFWGLVLRPGDFSRVAYDSLDELALFAGRASLERFGTYESRLLSLADATFATADMLERRLRSLGTGTLPVRVPNGVDYDWFQERATRTGTPDDLREIPHPIAGYVGILRDWFDYDLLGRLARAMTDISFVIVGPLDFGFRTAHLRRLPNLRWLGRRDYREMPRYISAFDACLIPFIPGRVSQTTNPVKIFEYFALGKPVVATPLHELLPYGEEGLLRIARGEEEFASALRDSLAGEDEHQARRRREVARAHSWGALTERMLSRLIPGAAT